MKEILKCEECGEYTMKDRCKCGGKVVSPKPAKFSLEDRWGKYRRMVKKNDKN